jgi:dipeptidyl-peptidase-4
MLADATTGKSSIILTESCDTYIKVFDDLYFMKNKKEFLWTSERDGYKHLYLIDFAGKVVKQITKGYFEMMALKGVDEVNGKMYYLSNENVPEINATDSTYQLGVDETTCYRRVIEYDLISTKVRWLSTIFGYEDAYFSITFQYYILNHSNIDTPVIQEIRSTIDKRFCRVINDNSEIKKKIKEYIPLNNKEHMILKSANNIPLNVNLSLPYNYEPNKKYPVIIYVYGGSGRNTVLYEWGGRDFMWQNMMAQKGYIIVSFDGRGTELRGQKFRNSIYKQMGKLETEDAIAVAKQVGRLRWVDSTRIGIQGWSFGGYLSSLCITKGADVFKAAVAIAPVTNWRYYDNIYTERFLQKPQDNPKGYDENSPINFAHLLRGKYLLIHGTGDDNVHFQNSVEMIRALQKANKQFEFMLYPDKAHGISGGNARFNLYEKVTDFWLRNL